METFRVLVVSSDVTFASQVSVAIGAHHHVEEADSESAAVELVTSGARFTAIVVDSSLHSGTELMGGLLVHAPDQAARVLLVAFDQGQPRTDAGLGRVVPFERRS